MLNQLITFLSSLWGSGSLETDVYERRWRTLFNCHEIRDVTVPVCNENG